MQFQYLFILVIVFPLKVYSQDTRLDTIPPGGSWLKVAGDFIIESTVDTAKTELLMNFLH